MIKTIKYILGVLGICLAMSCSDFLELKHVSNISSDDFNRNEEELYASLIGCYNGMQGALYREWAVTELRSDNARIYARTSTTSIFDVIRQLDIATIQPINYIVDEYWSGCYHNIERCNIVIRDHANVKDASIGDEYMSEAMFIRAYHYFNLVRLYGGVFLVTSPLSPEEAKLMRRAEDSALGLLPGFGILPDQAYIQKQI